MPVSAAPGMVFRPAAPALSVGLVNIMPRAAIAATDAQFTGLIQEAAGGMPVRIRRFALPGTADDRHESLDALFGGALDALVVTGTEPRANSMIAEPLWPVLSDLVAWAAEHTRVAVWSCFSAHAAVFRLDGIARRPLPAKLSGVFTCRKAGAHSLTEDAPAAWPVPHSRHNGLDARELAAAGYTVLSRAARVGPDSFAKQRGRGMFIFFQGHPEYAAETLGAEYRRDLRRFSLGQCARAPAPPEHYYDRPSQRRLAALQDADPLQALAALERRPPVINPPDWRPAARCLYAGWLRHAARQAARQERIFA